ncbi:MAG: ceramidase [Gammaproteobacteria bacterium]|nr:ceramidase [Gammaproteobacteria bacterium]
MPHPINRIVLISITVILLGVLLSIDPIAQDPAYYNFVDNRDWLGVSNAWNVLSNLGFIVVVMLRFAPYRQKQHGSDLHAYVTLFMLGVFFTAFGSAWFHWNPTTATLVWDRLPMTIAFSSFFLSVWHDYISARVRYWLWPVVLFSAATVFYWYWTETLGRGDLRPYIVVQFLPILLLPFILWLYTQKAIQPRPIFMALGFYILAKLAEMFDGAIYELTEQIISGHSVKHLLAAVAAYYILLAYQPKADTTP